MIVVLLLACFASAQPLLALPGGGRLLGVFGPRLNCSWWATSVAIGSESHGTVLGFQDISTLLQNPQSIVAAVGVLDAPNGEGLYVCVVTADGALSFGFARDCSAHFVFRPELFYKDPSGQVWTSLFASRCVF
jgi:hypothetical protein